MLNRNILLVDDSETDLYLMRTAFKKAEFNIALQELHNGEEAIAIHTSDVPSWALVRLTRVHVNPAVVILVTVVLGEPPSVATKASNNSLLDFVVKAGAVMVEPPF